MLRIDYRSSYFTPCLEHLFILPCGAKGQASPYERHYAKYCDIWTFVLRTGHETVAFRARKHDIEKWIRVGAASIFDLEQRMNCLECGMVMIGLRDSTAIGAVVCLFCGDSCNE
jgi:hypothetical protein